MTAKFTAIQICRMHEVVSSEQTSKAQMHLCGHSQELLPIVVFVDEMVSGAKSHQVSVVRRRGNGDRSGASGVCVAQLVSEDLQLVGHEVVVVPQDVVTRWSRSALKRSSQWSTDNLTTGQKSENEILMKWERH